MAGLVSTGDELALDIDSAEEPVAVQSGADRPGDDDVDLDAAEWHDMSLPLDERMRRVPEDAPLHHRLMAAMAQQDCGQCGYDCKGYSGALASGEETDPGLCVPGSAKTRKKVKALLTEDDTGPVSPAEPAPQTQPIGYARTRPYMATLKSVQPLNGPGSPKETVHAVIDLGDSGLEYSPGDSLGVYPRNNPGLVTGILSALDLDAQTPITLADGECMADEALTLKLDVTCPSDEALEWLARSATDPTERDALEAFAEESLDDSPLDLYDLLRRYPSARPAAAELLSRLNSLRPRLYSISSACRHNPDEVHLTVAAVRYEAEGRRREGVASTFISDRGEGKPLPIYFQKAHDFALPAADATPIIMIGPGTGIAPFRAFLQERAHRQSSGGAWLFFGNPHEATDFLYRDELQAFLETGVLSRLTTAFSRDGAEKVYVQDRIAQHSAELWRWIDTGAHIYVCGDATAMATAVHNALIEVIEKEGDHDKADAEQYLSALAKSGRYQRDVY
jgi:sulfite reductase (NADPH) flavoprotein alpha-component